MSKKNTVFAFFAVLLVTIIPLSSCDKVESTISGITGGGASSSNEALLKSMPVTAVGFITWNAASEAYEAFSKSAWGMQAGSTFGLLEKAKGNGKGEALEPLMNVLKKSGLFDNEMLAGGVKKPSPVKAGTMFFDVGNDGKTPGAGLYVEANKDIDLALITEKLKGAIKDEGIPVAEEKTAGTNGFVADFSSKVKDPEIPFKKMFVGANKDKLALGTSSAIVAQLFQPAAGENGYEKMKASPEYQKVSANTASADKQLIFGFLNFTKIVDAAMKFAPGNTTKDEIKDFPLTSASYARSMDGTPQDQVLVSFAPKTEKQKQILAALGSGSGSNLANKVPGDTLVWLSLDLGPLMKIAEAAAKEAPPEEAQQIQAGIAMAKGVKNLGIGIRSGAVGSPFPELMIVSESDNAAELTGMLKMQVAGALGGSGMPAGAWQQKDISGSKVNYMLTPFGVGAYIGSANGMVIVSSSEKAMMDVIGSGANKIPALTKSLPKSAASASEGSLLTAFSDVTKLAGLIETVQGSLAMFTGGQNPVDKSYTDSMKKVGSFMLSAKITGDMLKVQTNYDAPVAGS